MAHVLCIGTDKALMETRKFLLLQSGHTVVEGASSEPEVIRACQQHQFDVAVIGQSVSPKEKHRVLSLIREHCPAAKVLELYVRSIGKVLDAADDWIEMPTETPPQLAEKVSELAARRT